MRGILIFIIHGYQKCVAPWMGSHCRFAPSCSEYCKGALLKHGFARGVWLGLYRLLRCQPFSRGGYDPVG